MLRARCETVTGESNSPDADSAADRSVIDGTIKRVSANRFWRARVRVSLSPPVDYRRPVQSNRVRLRKKSHLRLCIPLYRLRLLHNSTLEVRVSEYRPDRLGRLNGHIPAVE